MFFPPKYVHSVPNSLHALTCPSLFTERNFFFFLKGTLTSKLLQDRNSQNCGLCAEARLVLYNLYNESDYPFPIDMSG